MQVENEATHIEEVPASRISQELGNVIKKLLSSSKCKNSAVKQSCETNKCKLVLHYSKKSVVHEDLNDIDGFITVTETSPNTAEIFNLCSVAVYINKELLKYVIEYDNHEDLWIGLRFDSMHFDENAILFVSLGFINPVVSRSSPSGVPLHYDFISLRRVEDNIVSESDYEETIAKIMKMKADYFSSKENVEKIKFKTFPQYYKPGTNLGRMKNDEMKTVAAIQTSEPKKSPTKSATKSSKKSPGEIKIGNIRVQAVDNFVTLYRRDKSGVAIQAKCLENYTPKGRLINKSEFKGKTVDEVYDVLKEGGYIHEGSYGVVYQACDVDNNCNYVIKIQIIKDKNALDTWKKEVEIMIKFNEYNIGPHIAAAWTCTDGEHLFGIFAAEKWDGNLGDLDIDTCPPKHLIDKFESQIKTIHKLGYVHGDIMPKNVLVKKDDDGNITDLTITDFGTVDTPANWKLKENSYGWIETFYDYHVYFGERGRHGFLWPYYENSMITLQDVVRSPALMDYDLLYHMKLKCR